MRGRSRGTIRGVRLLWFSFLCTSAYMPYSGLQSEIHQKRVPARTSIFMEGNSCYRTTVACLIRTGKILVSNSIDLRKKNKANISPLRTERASSKKVSWLWFYFELTDSIAHLHQRNPRASKTKTAKICKGSTKIMKTANICKYRSGLQRGCRKLQKLRISANIIEGPNENYENYESLPERHKNS